MLNIPDDPAIQRAEKYGTGGVEPICPVCGMECETVYKDCYGEILGCDCCLTAYDACEEEECFPCEDE